jgi:hypothetical protein
MWTGAFGFAPALLVTRPRAQVRGSWALLHPGVPGTHARTGARTPLRARRCRLSPQTLLSSAAYHTQNHPWVAERCAAGIISLSLSLARHAAYADGCAQGREGRWRPPRKPDCWTGVFNATAESNYCFQFFGSFGAESKQAAAQRRAAAGGPVQSEDCLYLDVFSTNLPGRRTCARTHAPCGGGGAQLQIQRTGRRVCAVEEAGRHAASCVHMDLRRLTRGGQHHHVYAAASRVQAHPRVRGARRADGPIQQMTWLGDVLVLAMNYRLSVLGFLTAQVGSHDARGAQGDSMRDLQVAQELIPGDPRGTSGNYGLLDQQLAMEWAKVRKGCFCRRATDSERGCTHRRTLRRLVSAPRDCRFAATLTCRQAVTPTA